MAKRLFTVEFDDGQFWLVSERDEIREVVRRVSYDLGFYVVESASYSFATRKYGSRGYVRGSPGVRFVRRPGSPRGVELQAV